MTRQLRQHCIVGEPRLYPQRQAEFRMHFAKDFNDLLKSRSGSGSVGVNIWLIGASARQEFFLRNSSSDQRVSMIWELSYHLGTVALENRSLSLIGQGASQRDERSKREICGDRFIDHVKLGSRVYLAVSLHFLSEEAYRQFRTRVTVSFLGGLIRFSREFVDTFQSFEDQVWLSVDVIQMGGDSEYLKGLGSEQRLFCDQRNLKQCAERFQAIYQYMYGAKGLQSSLREQDLSAYFPKYYWAADYRESLHDELQASQPGFEDKDLVAYEARKFQQIDRYLSQLSRLEYELSTFQVDDSRRIQYQAQIEGLQHKIRELQDQLLACRSAASCSY